MVYLPPPTSLPHRASFAQEDLLLPIHLCLPFGGVCAYTLFLSTSMKPHSDYCDRRIGHTSVRLRNSQRQVVRPAENKDKEESSNVPTRGRKNKYHESSAFNRNREFIPRYPHQIDYIAGKDLIETMRDDRRATERINECLAIESGDDSFQLLKV